MPQDNKNFSVPNMPRITRRNLLPNTQARLWSLLVISLIIGVLAGVGGLQFFQEAPRGDLIEVSELPVAPFLFTNPIVYQWSGSVEGVLVAKDERSLTLVKDETYITILLQNPSGKTQFYDLSLLKAEKGSLGVIALADIALGTVLRGNFFVVPGGTGGMIMGSSFSIVR